MRWGVNPLNYLLCIVKYFTVEVINNSLKRYNGTLVLSLNTLTVFREDRFNEFGP